MAVMTDSEDENMIITIESLKKDGKTVKEIAKALHIGERRYYQLMTTTVSADIPSENKSPNMTDDSKGNSKGGRPKALPCQMTRR